jgi:hypothetical protein
MALSCVAQQSQSAFWRLHDDMSEHQPEITLEKINDIVAARTKLNGDNAVNGSGLDTCLRSVGAKQDWNRNTKTKT